MDSSVGRPLRAARVALWGSASVLAATAVLFALPLSESVTLGISNGAVSVLWLLLMTAQIAAARRTTGIDRRAWTAMIAVDVLLFVLFATSTGTTTFLPTREGLSAVWLFGPLAAVEGLIVLLIFSRRLVAGTSRMSLAADAAWLAVAAQAIMWPTVGEPVLHLDADPVTVTTILAQGFVAACLAGTLGALMLRAAPGHMLRMLKVGGGIVTLRFTSVIFYASWLGSGISPGGAIDLLALLFMTGMVWSAAWGPEGSVRLRGHDPAAAALLAASWVPILIIFGSVLFEGFELDWHWALLLGVAGLVLVIRLSVELLQSGRLREQLHDKATTDSLTRLPNRATLDSELDRIDVPMTSVMVIDLDRFKAVNDQLGHEVGDELLRQVAVRLRSVLDDEWLLTRAGGDEFIAVSRVRQGTDDVETLADRVIDVLEPTFLIQGREAWIGASIGVAVAVDGVRSDELLTVADLALRHAKQAGRGEVVVSSPALRDRALDSHELARSLERGIDNGEIFCLYQPKVDLVGGGLVGVEALVRWNHPTRGVLLPLDFIDTAEATGLIARIDGLVLQEAVRELARWNVEYPGRRLDLSVNMSAWQLTRRDVDEAVVRSIASAGPALDPAQVTIELTETILIDDPVIVGRRLEKLRSSGVSVSVDDFGTGFTSVAHLRQFPISEVKIDRTLVGELGDSHERSVAGAVIALAQSLELDVVAEGVEAEQQVVALRRLGCRRAQGHLFSHPVPAEQIDAWLATEAPFAAQVRVPPGSHWVRTGR